MASDHFMAVGLDQYIIDQDDEDCPDSLQWWEDHRHMCFEGSDRDTTCNGYSKCIENR